MSRPRLDFEAVRETLLEVAGQLDPHLGGLPVDLESQPFSTRRTVYGLIDRQNLPGMFRTFDFSNPDTSSQRRFQTTVPQQALFLLNSPFVVKQARALVKRPAIADAKSAPDRIQALYQVVLQRCAEAKEVALGEKFLSISISILFPEPLKEEAQIPAHGLIWAPTTPDKDYLHLSTIDR